MPRSLPAFALGALSVGLVVAVLAAAGVIDDDSTTTVTTMSPAPSSPAQPRTSAASVADIYRRVSPGVVYVTSRQNAGTASGSGFLIDGDGSIVTNEHVVDNAERVRVRFGDNRKQVDARVVGKDPSTDVALLKVDADDIPGDVEPLELGSSKGLQPGDAAIAIGSPFGLEGTVTTGVISALNRDIRAPNAFNISGVVQTDAAINPGNSGGPLLDAQGRVIGINSQIESNGTRSNSGVGFAVPIDTVKTVVPVLERDGKVKRAWVGVTTVEASSGNGAVVRDVVAGGPAQKAGLRAGDRIVKVGSRSIGSPSDLGNAVNALEPGQSVEVVVVRGDDERKIDIKLGDRPEEGPQS